MVSPRGDVSILILMQQVRTSRGHLASQVVAFELSNGTQVIFKRLIFGCSSIFSQGADQCRGQVS